VELQDDFTAKLAATALVGFTGIGKAVTQDPLAAFQGRQNLFIDMLCAVGKHQAKFRQWRQAFSARAEQDSPQLFSQRCPAGLASSNQVNPALAEVRSQVFHLRGFAYAVKTFKGD
jgi:hypothetical protein